MEAWVWRIPIKLFPNERRYNGLRAEGDNLIELICELNSPAIARETGQGRYEVFSGNPAGHA